MFKHVGVLFSDQAFLVKSSALQFEELSNVFTGLHLEGKSIQEFYNYYAQVLIAKITDSVSPVSNSTVVANTDSISKKRQKVEVVTTTDCIFDHSKDVFEFPKNAMIKAVKTFLSAPKQKSLSASDKAAFEAVIDKSYSTEIKGKNSKLKNEIRIANSKK
jgi:hypothetical protein